MRTKPRWIALALAIVALLASGCALAKKGRVNPVEQARLELTKKIEVLGFDSSVTGAQPYTLRLTIADTQAIERLVLALDADLERGLKVQCIPEYVLRFHLEDGTLQEFGYSCDQVSFLRGEQDFWQGEDYRPPAEFDVLLQEQLALGLVDTAWTLVSLKGAPLLADTEIGLYFKAQYLGGAMTCNGYGGGPDSGAYTASEESEIRIPMLAMTAQGCPSPKGLMEQEAAYIEALHAAARYRMSGDRLEIENGAGETTLVFARAE